MGSLINFKDISGCIEHVVAAVCCCFFIAFSCCFFFFVLFYSFFVVVFGLFVLLKIPLTSPQTIFQMRSTSTETGAGLSRKEEVQTLR